MNIKLTPVMSWVRQPSTVTGLSALAATAAGVLTGEMSVGTAIPVLVFSLVAMILPDNTAAQRDARKLAVDAVSLVHVGVTAAQIAPVFDDLAVMAGDVTSSSSTTSA